MTVHEKLKISSIINSGPKGLIYQAKPGYFFIGIHNIVTWRNFILVLPRKVGHSLERKEGLFKTGLAELGEAGLSLIGPRLLVNWQIPIRISRSTG